MDYIEYKAKNKFIHIPPIPETGKRSGQADESIQTINLITGYEDENQKKDAGEKFDQIAFSLKDHGIELRYIFRDKIHDRLIKLDNGWSIKLGRGLDIYQKPESWFEIGVNDMDLRPCLETMVDIFKENN